MRSEQTYGRHCQNVVHDPRTVLALSGRSAISELGALSGQSGHCSTSEPTIAGARNVHAGGLKPKFIASPGKSRGAEFRDFFRIAFDGKGELFGF
jgi:hypothetical protein